MDKSKLGSPFKLKNQGVGGMIGAGVSGAMPSILNVFKLKYPDVFKTTEEKLEEEKVKLLQKQAELAERKFMFDVKKEAEDWDEELKKMDLEAKAKREQADYDARLRRQEIALQSITPEARARAAESTARSKQIIQETGQKAELFIGVKELQDLEITSAKNQKELEEVEVRIAKETEADEINNAKIEQHRLELEQADLARKMNEFVYNMGQQDFENMMDTKLYNLRVQKQNADIEYRKAIIALKEGTQSGTMSSAERSMLQTWINISANAMQGFNNADDVNSPQAQRALQLVIESIHKANDIMVNNGLSQYQMNIPLGTDKQGNIQYIPPSPQGGLAPRPQTQQSQVFNYQSQSPSEQLEYKINGLGVEVGTDEEGLPKYIFGEKKKVDKIELPDNINPVLKDYGEAKLNTSVGNLAKQYEFEVEEVLAFVKAESDFNPDVVGPKTKYGRAFGLMQLLESTAKDMGLSKEDIKDPDKNLEAGIKYLAWIRKNYYQANSVDERAWAYYGGVKNYSSGYLGPKTKAYKARVLRYYNFYKSHPDEAAKKIMELEGLINESK